MAKVKWYLIEGVNPQPWAIGPLGIGRRQGRNFPFIGPNKQLVAFQNAIKEELGDLSALPFDGNIELDFFLWRQIEEYKGRTRKVLSHQADATNIQKALEDALQGVLFPNDRDVQRIRTTLVEQSRTTEPRIVIRATPWEGLNPDDLPAFIWKAIDEKPVHDSKSNAWGGQAEGVF